MSISTFPGVGSRRGDHHFSSLLLGHFSDFTTQSQLKAFSLCTFPHRFLSLFRILPTTRGSDTKLFYLYFFSMSNYCAVDHPRTASFVLYSPLPFHFSHPLLLCLYFFFAIAQSLVGKYGVAVVLLPLRWLLGCPSMLT